MKKIKLMLDSQMKLGTKCNYASISKVFHILKLYHLCHLSQKDIADKVGKRAIHITKQQPDFLKVEVTKLRTLYSAKRW